MARARAITSRSAGSASALRALRCEEARRCDLAHHRVRSIPADSFAPQLDRARQVLFRSLEIRELCVGLPERVVDRRRSERPVVEPLSDLGAGAIQ